MRSHTTKRFRDCLARLPASVQRQARRAYRRFRKSPDHRGLKFRRVHTRDPVYSVRISRDYRALGILAEDDLIVRFWIGPHAEYDLILKRL